MAETTTGPIPGVNALGHRFLTKYLPEGLVDVILFLISHWVVRKVVDGRAEWEVKKENVAATLRHIAPHLKKNYEDEVRWGQLLDLLNFQLQIGVTDWMGTTLVPIQQADMILSMYENVRDDDPIKSQAKLEHLAETLTNFARLDDAAKLDYAVGRAWLKRNANEYPIHWDAIKDWMEREAAAVNLGTDVMNARLARHNRGLVLLRPIRRYFRGLGALFNLIPDNTYEVPVTPIGQPQAPTAAAGRPGRLRRLINAWR